MEEIVEHLKHRGFEEVYVPSTAKGRNFRGSVEIEGEVIRLDLVFYSQEYDYPNVYLTDWDHLPAIRDKYSGPHINTEGLVCHTDTSIDWWDVTLATRYIDGVLEQVEKILSDNLLGRHDYNEVLRDLDGYWPSSGTIYLSEKLSSGVTYRSFFRNNQHWVGTESNHWLNSVQQTGINTPWIVVHSKQNLIPDLKAWPPKNLGDLSRWIYTADKGKTSLQTLFRLLKPLCKTNKSRHSRHLSSKHVGVIFTSPDFTQNEPQQAQFAVKIELPSHLQISVQQGREKALRTSFFNTKTEIRKYSIQRGDPTYIHNRNLDSGTKTLKNKSILIVGAGTIGSFLADILCSFGAGSGAKGSLTIVDYDTLKVENIGRHLLGMSSVGRSKAKSLAEHLLLKFPHLDISFHNSSVFDTEIQKLLNKKQIIINASGCQTTSIGLEQLIRRTKREPHPIVLHSWIMGKGLAAISFISQSTKDPCYRCLWQFNNDRHKFRFELSPGGIDEGIVRAGCHNSYHPFPVMASISAANLAARVLYEHLNNELKNTLQFDILDPLNCMNRPNTSPNKLRNCPICSKKNDGDG